MKIDSHAHIVDREYCQALVDLLGLSVERSGSGQTLLRKGSTTCAWFRDEFFDPAYRVRRMDELGIDVRILSLSSPSVYDWPSSLQAQAARKSNDVLASMCRAYPDRFKGLATLPLGNVEEALIELRRALDELGFVGVAIGSHIGGKSLTDEALDPIWFEINRRRAPVVEHPMPPLGADHMKEFELPLRVGFVYETTTAAARMIYGGLFEKYPDFPFILPHTGGALLMLLERLDNGYRLFEDCRRHITRLPSEYAKRLYYDSCAFYGPALMLARDAVGPERVLWGTDDPFIGADTAHIDSLPIDAAEKAMILGGNAARIFGIPSS